MISHTPGALMINLDSGWKPMSLSKIDHPNISFVVVMDEKQRGTNQLLKRGNNCRLMKSIRNYENAWSQLELPHALRKIRNKLMWLAIDSVVQYIEPNNTSNSQTFTIHNKNKNNKFCYLPKHEDDAVQNHWGRSRSVEKNLRFCSLYWNYHPASGYLIWHTKMYVVLNTSTKYH